jgi:ABC-type branched-subunit amino acid transport system substrate-binding protein
VQLPAQVRSWARRSSRAERLLTGLSVVALLALLVTSMSLRPDDEVATAASSGGGPAEAAEGAPSPSAGELGADPGAAAVAGDPSGAASRGGAAPSGPAGSGAGGGEVAAVARTASDRGVTADAVTIGIITQAPGGLSSTGFSTKQRSERDGPRYVQALADWANRNGGVNGRRIRTVLRPTDPTSVEDQAAGCRAMVDDAKVFGVVDVAALLDTASLDCLTNRTKGDTPLVHSVMWSRDWQRRSGGNEVSYQAAIDRISVTWARDLGAMGWFPKGATVGILGDKCPATQPTIEGVLRPALEAQGAGRVVIGSHDCNISAVVGEPPNIATRFRLEGVTHVLLVSNFAAAQIFMTTAKSQGYTPRYAASDWFLNTSDPTTAGFPPDQFDGAVGITSIGASLRQAGMEPFDGWQECSQIAVDAGLAPMAPDDSASAELLGICDNLRLFLDALRAAGPNPTRATWRAAVATLGQRTSLVFGPSRFGPGKLTGSDTVHTVVWRRDCRCWRSVGGFRPAAA